jgi:hypothetical protein
LSNKYYVGGDITSFSDNGKYKPISRVTLLVDDENSLTAGDDTGMEVIASCPHATQPMVNALLQTMKGYQYQAYEAGAANIDPAAELGDGVTVGGIYSPLSKLSDDGRGYAGISSPGELEMEDEYPSGGYITQEFNRKIAETRSTITKTSEEINLKVEGIDGRVSDITQTVDGISLSVTSASSPDGQTTATITLKVGPNNYTGYIKLDGNVDVSGQLSADALYAALGEIADLSVNRLSTSRRVVKYLAKDTTDDNFIRVEGQSLEFVAGIAKSTTEQAKNPNGELIYWEADPAGASIGADGYPYANGERIFTTTKQTSWPVMVYQYEEQVKRAISFQSDGQYYYPVDVFGAGDNNGKQRGYLVKRQNSLELTYETSLGKQLGLAARDDGYMDLMGLRKSAALDFSEWDKGYFAELVDGEKTPYRYTVTFDQQRRPIKITDNSGHATLIRW